MRRNKLPLLKTLLIAGLAAVCLGSAAAQKASTISPVILPPALETGFIYVEDDVRLFYQRFGIGTPRIFIPSRADLSAIFAPLFAAFDVVTWDPRGRGLSDRPADLTRYGLDYEIADAEAIRKHFGAERITYVGISLWGGIAALYAARHPESVERAVALGPIAIAVELDTPPDKVISHDLDALRAEVAAMEADGRSVSEVHYYCPLEKYVVFSDSYFDLEDMWSFVDANLCQYQNEHFDFIVPVIFEGIFGSFGEWDWRDEVATVTQPLLVIYGDHDWANAAVRMYAELAHDGGWIEAANSGHHVWADRSDIVLPALEAFFRGEWPAGVNR